jgi:FkbM family methyltransferase
MLKVLRFIERPEYFFRPSQIWRRLRKNSLFAGQAVQLAWGLPMELDIRSHVGVDILNLGVYDRVVPEAIYRLSDPGEVALDIGANIGQNASIMALTLGPQGRVVAFEPGPESWNLLTRNVQSWAPYEMSPITMVRLGVSSHVGTGLLQEADELGGFSLEEQAPGPPRTIPEGASGINIELTTVDTFYPGTAKSE